MTCKSNSEHLLRYVLGQLKGSSPWNFHAARKLLTKSGMSMNILSRVRISLEKASSRTECERGRWRLEGQERSAFKSREGEKESN